MEKMTCSYYLLQKINKFLESFINTRNSFNKWKAVLMSK